MTGPSSTSSSEPQARFDGAGGKNGLPAWIGVLPRGTVCALLFVLAIHSASIWYADQPIAAGRLRHKVTALTADTRPSLVLAGDSRVRSGVFPAVIADELGLPAPQAVNIADAACDSSAVWSAYREFSRRFARRPVLMLDVSLFSVNDGADRLVRDEFLWSISLRERCQIVPPARALTACFLPEKALWTHCTARWLPKDAPFREGGYFSEHGRDDLTKWGPEDRRRAAATLEGEWYGQACVAGLRWAKLERDLRAFIKSGAQLVLLDPPYHPEFAQLLSPSNREADQQFHRQLADLGRRLEVPVLSCADGWFGDANPDSLFYDFVHLNRAGAKIYSRLLASRIRELANAGLVRLNVRGTLLAVGPE